jgi:hypothetical protein
MDKELTDIPLDEEPAFLDEDASDKKDEQEETPAASSAEKDKAESDPSHEGENTHGDDKTPLHKDERFKEVIRDRNEAREEAKRLRQEMDDFKATVTKEISAVKEPEDASVPSWFSDIYGDNKEAYQKYASHQAEERAQIKEEIRAEQRAQVEHGQKEVERWNGWVDKNLQDLRDEGEKFDKNELMKFLLEYRPTDDRGNIDFHKGLKLMQSMKPADKSLESRKRLASKTTSEADPDSKDDGVMTSQKLRNLSFKDLVS